MNAKVEKIDGNAVIYDNSSTGDTATVKAEVIFLATGRKPFTVG